jgi:DNA replication protein DnaC
LYQVEKELTARLEQAAKRELSYADFLDELLALEVGSKTEKHHQMRITMARFPFQKTLESFDFKFQPSIDVKLMRELAGGRYMASGDNVLLLGPPGVGKTHLAVALGIKACGQGVRTLFITATAPTCSSSWCHGVMSAAQSSSPATRVSGRGARCSVTP